MQLSDKNTGSGHSQTSVEAPSYHRVCWKGTRCVSEALKMVVADYLSAHYVRSVAHLARQSGVPYTTVRRIVQGQGTADLSTVNLILGVVLNQAEHLEFISVYYPECYSMLATTFSAIKVRSIDRSSGSPPVDPALNYIMHICSAREGTCQQKVMDQIKDRYGVHGLRSFEAMLEADYLKIVEGHVYVRWDRFQNSSYESILLKIKSLTSIFNPSHLGTDAALIGLVSEYVSEEGLRLIKQAGQEYLRKVGQVHQKYKGKDMIYYLGVMQNIYDRTAEASQVYS